MRSHVNNVVATLERPARVTFLFVCIELLLGRGESQTAATHQDPPASMKADKPLYDLAEKSSTL